MINQPAEPPVQPGPDPEGPARPARPRAVRVRARTRGRTRAERRTETPPGPVRHPGPRVHLRPRGDRAAQAGAPGAAAAPGSSGRTDDQTRPDGRTRTAGLARTAERARADTTGAHAPDRAPERAPDPEPSRRPSRHGDQAPGDTPTPARAGRRPRAARPLVLLAAFVCAACGLVYELELVALGGYLLGDSVTQTSVVLSVMVFAMGVGSLAAKRFTHRPATFFAVVECALAVVGGLSVLALYSCWAWLGRYQVAMIGLTCAIGVLIGAEIPLLLTLLQRIRREEAGRAAADLFAADYIGALIGGLAFPFVLLPLLGQATGALLTGAVNAVAGAAVVLWLFRDEPGRRARPLLWTGCGAVLAVLALAAACTGAIERAARQALYGGPTRQAVQSRYGELVLTGAARVPAQGAADQPLRLYLAGRLAACGQDEYRFHEALVHPALAGAGDGRVLLFGGGDGLALREVLRHRGVREVLVVTLDPALPALARTDPALAALGGHSFADPRVRLVPADPLAWLRADGGAERFDAVLADLPAPERAARSEYHATEFYQLAAARLAPAGRLAVPAPAGPGLWTVEAGLRAAGLATVPFPVPGRGPACDPDGSGDRAAVLLAARDQRPALALAPDAPPPRSLTPERLAAAAAALAAERPTPLPPPSTLLHPR
ncbi:spermidine synthase [Kitasatospora sp. NBC_01287]|uniref:spermine/spermidine synthase domain-containing protein n=1 Tax=Kitasatospora sp. NBC_01287 TaxID=2903573 RepID=UPI002252A94C|nr:spermidine synthase [Kitasatospora sp. NBC_01287]MCX4747575.1 spermidine synthase [Kitasatospora sp. NBC_01287]